jgi:hypothetical protein
MRKLALVSLCLGVALLLSGCRQSQQSPTPAAAAIQIMLDTSPVFTEGKADLLVIVLDANNAPINDAKIEVVGDMTHAGMAPSFGNAAQGSDGKYRVPFEWTMGGEWIVTVNVTLSDGQVVSQKFNVNVKSS